LDAAEEDVVPGIDAARVEQSIDDKKEFPVGAPLLDQGESLPGVVEAAVAAERIAVFLLEAGDQAGCREAGRIDGHGFRKPHHPRPCNDLLKPNFKRVPAARRLWKDAGHAAEFRPDRVHGLREIHRR
jgi:hypothetical protein